MTDDWNRQTRGVWVFRFGVAMLVSMAVLLIALGAAWTQPDRDAPVDVSMVAVAIIDASMEETRTQALDLPAGYIGIVCTLEGLDQTLRDAYEILVDDPLFSRWVKEWRTEYWAGLVACSKGDLPKASIHLTPAFNAAGKMLDIAGRSQ